MILNLGRFALVGALLAGALAQSSDTEEKVWAVAAFINHGERTPLISDLNTVQTPEGAQQMLRSGSAFRARYVRNGVNSTEYEDWEKAYIQNINKDVIDNNDLDIYSQNNDWASASALAFMQGFYPPAIGVRDSTTGGSDIARDYVDGNETEYPLGGYQYPKIVTLGITDEQSPAIQGTSRCSAWEAEIRVNLTQDKIFRTLHDNTLDWYRELFSTAPLAGTVDLRLANFFNAYLMYDYVNYMYSHNESVYNNLKTPNITFPRLAAYAFDMERGKNSFANKNGIDDPTNVLYTIAGRTLATRVAQQFRQNVDYLGRRNRLTLMFGSYEPILSFVSLALLDTPARVTAGPFNRIPQPGAALVFELYGNNPSAPSRQPDPKDLKVRFYYRPSSNPGEKFQLLPLFGSKVDASNTSYNSFIDMMMYIGRDQYEWCDICAPTPAAWCATSVLYNDQETSYKKALAPAVGGIIGAVVTLTILGIISVGLVFFGGFRLRRVKKEGKMSGGSGGFKGIEKKEADKDVVVARTGAHHERCGSWELRDGKPVGGIGGSGVIVKDLPRERDLSPHGDDDDDGISILGATPVKAHESV